MEHGESHARERGGEADRSRAAARGAKPAAPVTGQFDGPVTTRVTGRKRRLAGALAVMLGTALVVLAADADASAGSVTGHAYGLAATVDLLGLAQVNLAAQPTADYPSGPATDDVLGVTLNGVLSTGVVTATATGDPLADTSASSASVNGTNLVSSLVTADAIGSTCTGTPAGVTGAATLANASVGLPLLSRITLPVNPAPNTTVMISTGLGIDVAKVVLNEQATSTVNGVRTLQVAALHLTPLSVPVVGLGVGDVRVGVASCGTTAPTAPTVANLTPVTGPTTGGTAVTITGSNFLGVDHVTFGGQPAAFTLNSTTQLTAITPAHAAGPVTVAVQNTAGTATGSYTYREAPTLSALAPDNGPVTGGTTVVITGSGFTGVTGVDFGGSPATYTVDSATQITAQSPAGVGTVPVHVTTAGGTTPTVAASYYRYFAVPTLTGLSPAQGSTTGGTTVTLTGSGFTGNSTVDFGGVAVPVTVLDDATIRVVSPSHAVGAVNVTVTTEGGTTAARTFTYLELPVVTAITPDHGPTAGGNTVTITGTGLSAVIAVAAEGAAQAPGNQTDTSLTVVAPGHAPGPVDVYLVGPGTTLTPAGTYTFEATPVIGLPVVTGLNPATGRAGTRVTVSGAGFTGATGVTFGGVAGTNPHLTSDGQLEVDAPAGIGAVSVAVTTPIGTSLPVAASTFTYAPKIDALDPGNGPITGGTVVDVTGSGFTPAATATVGGTQVPVSYVSSTHVTLTTPPHLLGNRAVVVSVGAAASNAVGFTYLALPTVSGLSPNSGPTAGGTTVTVQGLALDVITSVEVGGSPATDLVTGPTSLSFRTPAHGAGAVQVILRGPLGMAVNAGAFVFQAGGPAISSLAPATGPLAGGTAVTVSGSGFAGASVTVGGTAVAASVTTGGSTLTFTTPAGTTAGAVPVVVTTPAGTVTATFTYLAPPDAVGLTPSVGSTSGGTVVTISGSNLADVTGVRFDTTSGTQLTVLTPNLLTVRAPAHAAGTVNVVVTGPGGTDTLPFRYVTAPTLSGLLPTTGPAAGGTAVTLTGAGFTGVTTVRFGTSAATSVQVMGDGAISATAPAHGPGTVAVTVVGPGGESASLTFTYTGATTPSPVPSVSGLSPSTGPVAGGTTVTLTGTGLTGATAVTFGGTGAAFTVVGDTQILATAPAHAAGDVALVVTGPGGTSPAKAYTYTATVVPAVSSSTPDVGLTAGESEVTLRGSGFTGATGVKFGRLAATRCAVASDTVLVATTPQQPAGVVAVSVTGPGGTSPVVSGASFRYLGASDAEDPDVTAVDPALGTAAGGTRVTIRAAHLDATTRVTFNGVAGTDLRLGDDTTAGGTYDPAQYPFTTFDGDGDGHPDAFDGTLDGRGIAAAATTGGVSLTDAKDVDYQVGTASVVVPTVSGGATDVTVTTAAGSDTMKAAFLAVPKLTTSTSLTATTSTGKTLAVHPTGQAEGKLTVTACGTAKYGSVKLSDDATSCVYTAPAVPVADEFTMAVVNALGETQEQVVKMSVASASSTSDATAGTGSSSGTTDRSDAASGTTSRSSSRLAFTGVPTALLVAVGGGAALVLAGFGLLLATGGAHRHRADDDPVLWG